MSYSEFKQQIIDQLNRTAEVAAEIGSRSLADDIRHTRVEKIQEERFHVVVLGEFNHGKSTFVNAILGKPVLPAGITPTTATLNHIVYADKPTALVKFRDGKEQDIPAGDLSQWVTTEAKDPDKIAYVEIGQPVDLLRDNITLVDTPGVNDLNEQRAEITYGYVPRADAVIFLLDAAQALKESEREFLTSHILEIAKNRLVFVVGKIDVLADKEQREVIDYVKRSLTNILGEEKPVYPLSAKDYLEGKKEGSGVPPFMDYLKTFLEGDRMKVLLQNATEDALRAARYVGHNLQVKQHALKLGVDELEGRVSKVKEQLEASQKDLAELHVRIRSEASAMKTQVDVDLQAFTRDFLAALPAQIDSVRSNELKTYLPRYLEDKFREWAYKEGEKLAAHMKALSEDVITVTNQSVESVSQVLSEQLSPEDTQIKIDINSFKYDVGIYALGAIGTVFLFVNTLAGGLLTLAAPILSIIVKSKVDGDIREQAKERAPSAIKRAAEAVKPHFDECIDDFATKLSSFVTTAGNSLYKGIDELLSKTLEERRAHAESIEDVTKELDAYSEELGKVESNLTALKQKIDASDALPSPHN